MLRIAMLVLVATSAFASAEADDRTAADLRDTAKRFEARSVRSYDNTLSARDPLARLHDGVMHPEYDRMKEARASFELAKTSLEDALAAGDLRKASDRLDELEEAGKALDTMLSVYTASSSNSVERIQIGLGVIAFVICGAVVLLVRGRKKRNA